MSTSAIITALAIPGGLLVLGIVWQQYHSERIKKSEPSPVYFTYLVLGALKAVKNLDAEKPIGGLTYDELYKEVIRSINNNSEAGNFSETRKRKKLCNYLENSIELLRKPRGLAPLVEYREELYTITDTGVQRFEDITHRTGSKEEATDRLDLELKGRLGVVASSPMGDRPSLAGTSQKIKQNRPERARIRFEMFGKVMEQDPIEFELLIESLKQEFGWKRVTKQRRGWLVQAREWNIANKKLALVDNDRVSLAMDSEAARSQTIDEFRDRKKKSAH